MATFESLPNELLLIVLTHMAPRDVLLNMRPVSRQLRAVVDHHDKHIGSRIISMRYPAMPHVSPLPLRTSTAQDLSPMHVVLQEELDAERAAFGDPATLQTTCKSCRMYDVCGCPTPPGYCNCAGCYAAFAFIKLHLLGRVLGADEWFPTVVGDESMALDAVDRIVRGSVAYACYLSAIHQHRLYQRFELAPPGKNASGAGAEQLPIVLRPRRGCGRSLAAPVERWFTMLTKDNTLANGLRHDSSPWENPYVVKAEYSMLRYLLLEDVSLRNKSCYTTKHHAALLPVPVELCTRGKTFDLDMRLRDMLVPSMQLAELETGLSLWF